MADLPSSGVCNSKVSDRHFQSLNDYAHSAIPEVQQQNLSHQRKSGVNHGMTEMETFRMLNKISYEDLLDVESACERLESSIRDTYDPNEELYLLEYIKEFILA